LADTQSQGSVLVLHLAVVAVAEVADEVVTTAVVAAGSAVLADTQSQGSVLVLHLAVVAEGSVVVLVL